MYGRQELVEIFVFDMVVCLHLESGQSQVQVVTASKEASSSERNWWLLIQ